MKKRFLLMFIFIFAALFVLASCSCNDKGNEKDPAGEEDLKLSTVVMPSNATLHVTSFENMESHMIVKYDAQFKGNTLTSFVAAQQEEGDLDSDEWSYYVLSDGVSILIVTGSDNTSYYLLSEQVIIDSCKSIMDSDFLAIINEHLNEFTYNKEKGQFEATVLVEEALVEVPYQVTVKIENGYPVFIKIVGNESSSTVILELSDISKTVVNYPDFMEYLTTLSEDKFNEYMTSIYNDSISTISFDWKWYKDDKIYFADSFKVDFETGDFSFFNIGKEESASYYTMQDDLAFLVENAAGVITTSIVPVSNYDMIMEMYNNMIEMLSANLAFSNLEVESYDYLTDSFVVTAESITISDTNCIDFVLEVENGRIKKISYVVDNPTDLTNGLTQEYTWYDYDQTEVNLPLYDTTTYNFTERFINSVKSDLANCDINLIGIDEESNYIFRSIYVREYKHHTLYRLIESEDAAETEIVVVVFGLIDGKNEYTWSSDAVEGPYSYSDKIHLYERNTKLICDAMDLLLVDDVEYDSDYDCLKVSGYDGNDYHEFYISFDHGKLFAFEMPSMNTSITISLITYPLNLPADVQAGINSLLD